MWNNVANIPSFVPKATSVPAGSRNRPASVPAGSRNRPTSVLWRPGYYNHMNMDEGRRGTAVKPSAGLFFGEFKGQICNGDPRTMENPHMNRDLRIVDSGCSRSMTGNKEKLDNFVKIVGGTVTFRGGDGLLHRKGILRTSKLNFENVLLCGRAFQTLTCGSQSSKKEQSLLLQLSDIKPKRDVTVCWQKVYSVQNRSPAGPKVDEACLIGESSSDHARGRFLLGFKTRVMKPLLNRAETALSQAVLAAVG
ncbi:hypothetical protein Tco_0590330 [Tanacetum coccineum]